VGLVQEWKGRRAQGFYGEKTCGQATGTGTGRVLLTHLLTPWSTVLLQKLTGLWLVMKFPAFY
jgi:hypothetical protein